MRCVLSEITEISGVLGIIIQVGSVVTLIYALVKFTRKPHDDLATRVTNLEEWKTITDQRLHQGAEHFSSLDKSTTVMLQGQLAIMDALISGDNKAELQEKRNELYKYITSK